MIYIISGLAIVVTLFLISITVQLLKLEKRFTELGLYIETRLSEVLSITIPTQNDDKKSN